MRTALIVCSGASARAQLCALLEDRFQTAHASDATHARQMIDELDPDLVLVNDPIGSESGETLARDAVQLSAAGVALFMRAPAPEDFERLGSEGVAVFEKPFHRQQTSRMLWAISSAKRRLEALDQRNRTLLMEIDSLRLVARAKALLIQYLNMTEPQAHRFIEKQAMDRRVSKRQVAEGILSSYEPERRSRQGD
ncbi:MAG: ANTAR domain-containing protein [Oscillospiraceae bacterium]|jgi:response regulator NasT|nr:ANTAR domain-containing protein [Oscillospiraceae bacterium]